MGNRGFAGRIPWVPTGLGPMFLHIWGLDIVEFGFRHLGFRV